LLPAQIKICKRGQLPLLPPCSYIPAMHKAHNNICSVDVTCSKASQVFFWGAGLSILVLLNCFDYVVNAVIDLMHHLFLHMVPEMLDLWFSEEYKVSYNL